MSSVSRGFIRIAIPRFAAVIVAAVLPATASSFRRLARSRHRGKPKATASPLTGLRGRTPKRLRRVKTISNSKSILTATLSWLSRLCTHAGGSPRETI